SAAASFRSLNLSLDRSGARRRAGLHLAGAPLLGHRIVGEDLALEDPDLDPAGAVGRHRRGLAVVDVGTQRVQRHPALTVPLHAGDLGAPETAGAVDPDALDRKSVV